MLLYVVFILLPATALAQCQQDVYSLVFKNLDMNGNGEIGQDEYDYFFTIFDANRDFNVTVEEIINRSRFEAPEFKGHEQEIFDFLNVDKANETVVDYIDRVSLFRKIDIDNDARLSREEFERYVETYCIELKP